MDMAHHRGFSLIEIIISLLVITSTVLALLQQQWHLSQLLNQALTNSLAATQLHNNVERVLVKQPLADIKKPLRLVKTEFQQGSLLQLSWDLGVSTRHLQCEVVPLL